MDPNLAKIQILPTAEDTRQKKPQTSSVPGEGKSYFVDFLQGPLELKVQQSRGSGCLKSC